MKNTKLILGMGLTVLLIMFPQIFLVLLAFMIVYLFFRRYSKSQKNRKVKIEDVVKYAFGQKPRKLIFLGDIDGMEVFRVSDAPLFILHKGITTKCLMGAKINSKLLGEKKTNDILHWIIERSLNGYPISVIITRNMEIRIIAESSKNGLKVTQEMVNDLVAETSSILRNTLEMILLTNDTNVVKILDSPFVDLGGVYGL